MNCRKGCTRARSKKIDGWIGRIDGKKRDRERAIYVTYARATSTTFWEIEEGERKAEIRCFLPLVPSLTLCGGGTVRQRPCFTGYCIDRMSFNVAIYVS